jgi:hypothetical protein
MHRARWHGNPSTRTPRRACRLLKRTLPRPQTAVLHPMHSTRAPGSGMGHRLGRKVSCPPPVNARSRPRPRPRRAEPAAPRSLPLSKRIHTYHLPVPSHPPTPPRCPLPDPPLHAFGARCAQVAAARCAPSRPGLTSTHGGAGTGAAQRASAGPLAAGERRCSALAAARLSAALAGARADFPSPFRVSPRPRATPPPRRVRRRDSPGRPGATCARPCCSLRARRVRHEPRRPAAGNAQAAARPHRGLRAAVSPAFRRPVAA